MVALGKNQKPAVNPPRTTKTIGIIKRLKRGRENLRLGGGGGAACSTTGRGFGKDSTWSAGTKPRSDSGSGSGGGGGAVSQIGKSEERTSILGKCKKGKRFWGACQA